MYEQKKKNFIRKIHSKVFRKEGREGERKGGREEGREGRREGREARNNIYKDNLIYFYIILSSTPIPQRVNEVTEGGRNSFAN